MPTPLPKPWPSGPVVTSTPGVTPRSGWPGVMPPHSRNRLILLMHLLSSAGFARIAAGAVMFSSNRHSISIELMILVVTALAGAEVRVLMHELDGLDPLHHLEAELVLTAQPQRRAVDQRQWRAVHLIGEDGQRMPHVSQVVHVVVDAAIGAFGERVKDGIARLARRPHDIQDAAHRNTAPLGDAGPALDAEMLGDLLLLGHRLDLGIGELLRMLDQATDAQSVVDEAVLLERLELVGHRQRAVDPVMRRYVPLPVLDHRTPRFGCPFEPADHDFADVLDQSGVLDRKG